MFSLISYSEKCGKSELHIYLTECVNKTPVGTVLVGGALIHRVKWAKHATYASYICPHKVWKQLHCCFYGYDQGPSIKVFTPIMTDLAAACTREPAEFVRCQCKLSPKNPCGTNICSCRENGLKRVTACGDCRGEGSKNAEEIILDVDEESAD